MPLSVLPAVIVSSVSTLTASGTTMLVLAPESDLVRSGGVIGIILAAMGAATAAHYALMDRRLRRSEALLKRVVSTERAVLDVLNEDIDPPGHRTA